MEKLNHPTFIDHRGSYTPIILDNSDFKWVQCSLSINHHTFTFRGLHYQTIFPQTKYVKVVQGSIIDFMVDLETKEVEYIKLDEQNSVLIPNNKLHGFLTLEPDTIVCYLVDNQYSPENEHSVVWESIEEVRKVVESFVPLDQVIVSEKDKIGK